MKLLRYCLIFREFLIFSLLFVSIERMVTERSLANYINPDYNIFINFALFIILIFAAFAMFISSGRVNGEKADGSVKYVVFILVIILMNIPHDSSLFYAHLENERTVLLETETVVKKTGRGNAEKPPEIVKGNGFADNNEVFIIRSENFFSAAEDIFTFPDKYINKKIQVKGFVYKSRKVGENRYIIARLVMYCCAADAGITGFIFETQGDKGFRKDEWLDLYGHIEIRNMMVSGMKKKDPVLVVESYKRIPADPNPYVYPVY